MQHFSKIEGSGLREGKGEKEIKENLI